MSVLEALILALVEGLTEFLPISSTAHLLFAEHLLGITPTDYVKMFTVSIQFGAILAVVVVYRQRFFIQSSWTFYKLLVLSVIPALVLGKLFDEKIEAVFEKPLTVAVVLILGGAILLCVDRIFSHQNPASDKDISLRKGVLIGFWQCLAMMPGVSRSAASIVGGLQQGLSRKAAAEFSFFLAVPTMASVAFYSLMLKNWEVHGEVMKGYEMVLDSNHNTMIFLLGNVASFAVAFLAVKTFIGFLQRYGFKIWGIYRMVVGLILVFIFLNYPSDLKSRKADQTTTSVYLP